MPRRDDLQRIMILGSGPIRIGQAAEFDFSGSQACRALRADGFEVILVNSNPATIQNDPEMADCIYIEPLLPDTVRRILEIERPDALLAGMGGQTALNIASALSHDGTLDELEVELIGCDLVAIDSAEDRDLFKKVCESIDLPVPRALACDSIESVLAAAEETGDFPLLVRPAFTLGGLGGGTAWNTHELVEIASQGILYSQIGQVLIEESILGWQEHEYEVMRDAADNCIIVCTMENIDPMGVHTGESVVVAPQQTLSDRDHQMLRDAALKLIRRLDIKGGCNVQFAVEQSTGEFAVIEVNPRVSRSSALASKATGYPIARMAALIAVGYTLDELPNPITGEGTTAAFEPTLDYCVVKIPRWPFDKFRTADRRIGTSMKSTGEVMAIGRTFEEAFRKAWASLEYGCPHPRPLTLGDTSEGEGMGERAHTSLPDDILTEWLAVATDRRMGALMEAFRRGWTVEQVREITEITRWFLHKFERMAQMELEVVAAGKAGLLPAEISADDMSRWKSAGFTDANIADALAGFQPEGYPRLPDERGEAAVMRCRHQHRIHPVYRMVDSCAAEFAAVTPYYYATYEPGAPVGIDHVPHARRQSADGEAARRLVVIGSGPIRIGQGIEFDYCCVQAVFGLKDQGFKTIMVNCNPETVSTDFDLVDRLYFEPVTFEDVLNIVEFEKPEGVLVQFGGQTPLKIANALSKAGVPILGTSPENIDLAEDREKFGSILEKLKVVCPEYGTGRTLDEVVAVAEKIGYPVLARPSYVLGGRAMEIVYAKEQLIDYISRNADVTEGHPILIDEFLEDAFEFDVDALCDGESVHIGAVMQHIEEAGIHSGDSACVLPPYRITTEAMDEIIYITQSLALELNVIGLINLQFAYKDGQVYVLEVNPRASRTVPFVSKTTNVPLARIAAQLAAGATLSEFELNPWDSHRHVAVKEAVLPFNKFPEESIFLSPEMKSTGEVMGISNTLGDSFRRASISAGNIIPHTGTVFLSVNNSDKLDAIPIARDLIEIGFNLVATSGTAKELRRNGIQVESVYKVGEGRPNIVDGIKNGEINLVINTPMGAQARYDEESIGRSCIQKGIVAITTLSGANAAVRAIRLAHQKIDVKSIQEFHK